MSSVPAPLRALESWTFERDGEALCMLRDPLGLAGEAGGLAMPASFLHVARRFDGRSDVDELASALSAPGRELGRETVAKVARYLSEQRCLEDASYDDAHAAALAEFRALHARPAIGAGLDYEADATELRIRVAGLVADDWDLPTPRGLTMALAPSCQLARGARLYSRTYAALRHASARFARVLLLAAAPSPLERALVPLAKDLETPMGSLRHDAEGVAAMRIEPGADELAHRSALTLERQALFLRLLWPRVPIVPCLVSAPPRGPRGASHAPGPRDAHEDAVAACERALALEGDTLVLVASDLGRALAEHAGPEVHRLASDDQRAARERDKRAVDAALAFDAAAFWNEASLDAGTTSSNPLPLWLALRLCQPRRAATAELGHLRGSVLGYQQLPGRGELTTAASLVFHREPREAEELRDQSPPSPSSSPSSPE